MCIRDSDYTISGGGGGLSPIIPLIDNTVVPTSIASFDTTNYKSAVLEYSIVRAATVRTGRIFMSSDGLILSFTDDFTDNNPTGITLSGSLSGSVMSVDYISTSTGIDASFRYMVRKLTS